jgi:hypothetical protein
MDVLVLSMTSGNGGQKLPTAKKANRVGFKRKDDLEYANVFPNHPMEIPEGSKYPLAYGAWTDVTFTVPVEFDSRVVKVETLPRSQHDYITTLFDYFPAQQLYQANPRYMDIKYLDGVRD